MNSTIAPIPARHLVFIDAAVEQRHILEEGVAPGTEIILIPDTDGIAYITDYLANCANIASLHIVSHGAVGRLQLGTTELSLQTLERYTSHLKQWADAMLPGSEILLYGCHVGAGSQGVELIHRLKALTGADIAASDDLTGNPGQGGDWQLEVTTGPIATPIAFGAEAIAAYPSVLAVILREDFTGRDVTVGQWQYGGGKADNGTDLPDPFLTARNILKASNGGIPGSPGGAINSNGQGALRLTNSDQYQASFVFFDVPIESEAGLRIQFDFFSYDGKTDGTNGADGLSFFLIDGDQATPKNAGAFGGSLGYAQRNTGTFIDGLVGGYLGIGYDEYGNFSAASEGRVGGRNNSDSLVPDSIAIRGSRANDYKYLTGTGTLPISVDEPATTIRTDARRRTQIVITPEGQLSVFIDLNGDNDYNDASERPITGYDLVAANGALPSTFKFGFAASTGTYTNIHEVQNLSISTIVNPNSLRPTVRDVSTTVDAGASKQLQGLSGTDPDGRVVYYTILSLPDVSAGKLFLGDPTKGGTLVKVNDQLSLDQIKNLFFQATNGFAQVTTFKYTASDNSGLRAAKAGTVTISPTDGGVVTCGPGVTLAGGAGNDTLRGDKGGDTGADVLSGRGGNDVLRGLECNDTLDGGAGRDRLAGGAGRDRLLGQGGNDTLDGGAGDDIVVGGFGRDRLFGSSGNDRLRGQAGNDRIYGELGNDLLLGNLGRDLLYAGAGDDTLDGGLGDDALGGGAGNDQLDGNTGNDRIAAGIGKDTTSGGDGNDSLYGGADNDLLQGDDGNDQLLGGLGRDTLQGGEGDDLLVGKKNNDLLRGDAGGDKLFGGAGNDSLNGGQGNDSMRGGADDDTLRGDVGRDTLIGAQGNDSLLGNLDDDRLFAGDGRDYLFGGFGDDTLNGGTGDDTLEGFVGSDILVGGDGNDQIMGGIGHDTLLGGIGDDTLRGGDLGDTLQGGAGADRLFGDQGGDMLTGDLGKDTLVGGAGADQFVLTKLDDEGDFIQDFEKGDRIVLKSIFTADQFSSANPFKDYVRLVNRTGGTLVQVNVNGDSGATRFRSIALVAGVAANTLTANSFVV